MIPIDSLIIFLTASLLLALAPGPDNIFVLMQSIAHGKLSGLLVTLGLCTGLIVHTAAVALGVAVIFKTSAIAFTALKLLGAAYLLYLAWQVLRAPVTPITPHRNKQIPLGKLYRRGIIMNVTNPKVSIFFLAFLPQFADPARGSLPLQISLLGLIFMAVTILVFGSVAMLAGHIGNWLKKSKNAQMIMNRVTGAVFVGLALKLALTQR